MGLQQAQWGGDGGFVLGGERPARVTIDVAFTEGKPKETILLTGRLTPHDQPPVALELPLQVTYRDPQGWPPEMLVAFERAWQEVVAEESASNPNFKRVYDSYARFRENYAVWRHFSTLQ